MPPDAPIAFAECFTFITTTGTVYTWTSVDYDVGFNGFTFNASGPLVSGLKYKGSVGLEVDKQQITIAARPTDLINGAPLLIALRDGAFDGAPVYRDRVFLTGPAGSVVGGVRLFQGHVSTVDNVGRTQATLTVASDLVILDYDMPKNLFSPTCLHVLYDAGCGIVRGTFSLDGACGAGSNSSTINFSGSNRPVWPSSTTWSTSGGSPTCRLRKWLSEDEMKHVFPYDLVVENKTAAALRRTLAYLEEHGWRQGTATGRNGGVCVGYAIQMVAGGLCSPAADRLRQVIGSQSIEAWNDSKLTTFATIRATLLEAIDA